MKQLQKKNHDKIISGGYLEPRPLYTSSEYEKVGNSGKESRSIHLGIDFWISEGTPVHAPYQAKVVISVINHGEKAYGGLIILRHEEEGISFFSLYGHLSEKSISEQPIGNTVAK